jgi:class 3 adenylate cyclase
MLRQKALHDTVQEQGRQLAEWNAALEERVAAQVQDIERLGRLRRFLPPQVAELVIASEEGEGILKSHRREVTVMFCDLRGFTAFAETAEPEEVMDVLRDYHACLGGLIFKHGGTLERFVGDGLLVVMNDPVPCPDHPLRTVRMALEMRECMGAISAMWRRRGHDLGFGIGIAQGYATMGQIGFEGRVDYSAIGTIPNLASRLCGEAKAGQILVSHRVFTSVEGDTDAAFVGELSLKGFHKPVPSYEVMRLRESASTATSPAAAD